ncbi:MAG: TetR/AcrR family transcriptional regulator [Candidatus Obscuribacterales bacterium]|nr:TetR/AcrR family transcriptional regulator [Candidatus Obscuribacterales bacterium]
MENTINSRRDKKRVERQHQILDAASSLFKVRGYDQTSIDDIAREADIARGTVFYNFESKEDIVFALRFRSVDEAKERALDLLAQAVPALKCIENFLVEVAQWTEKNPELAEVLWRHGPVSAKRFLKTEMMDEKITGAESRRSAETKTPPAPPNLVPIELVKSAQSEKTMRSDVSAERLSHYLNFILIHGQMEWLQGDRKCPLSQHMLESLKIILEGLRA